MNPHKFRFSRRIHRNAFTIVFGRVGKRRFIHIHKRPSLALRFKMQTTRRANQGWRNRVYGSIIALQTRRMFGRHKTVSPFRR